MDSEESSFEDTEKLTSTSSLENGIKQRNEVKLQHHTRELHLWLLQIRTNFNAASIVTVIEWYMLPFFKSVICRVRQSFSPLPLHLFQQRLHHQDHFSSPRASVFMYHKNEERDFDIC